MPCRTSDPFAGAPFDLARMVAAYEDYDAGLHAGRGFSVSADSGRLGSATATPRG